MFKLIFSISILATFSCCSNKRKVAATTDTNSTSAKATANTPKQANDMPETEGIVTTVKIIRTSCASVVAIITEDSKLDKGEEWVPYNVRMTKPYRGTFSIINLADFNSAKENFIFKAKLITADKAPKTTGEKCTLEDYPPATQYYVKALTTPKEEQ